MSRAEHKGTIILSGPMYETGQMSSDTLSRLDTGLCLWRENGLPLILVGSSSQLMFDELGMRSHGPTEGEVFTEPKSRDTVGNAVYSKTDILRPEGFAVGNLVTADYHVQRASAIFSRVLGPNFQLSPVSARTNYSYAERKKLHRKEILYSMIARAVLSGYDSSSTVDDEKVKSRLHFIARNRYT